MIHIVSGIVVITAIALACGALLALAARFLHVPLDTREEALVKLLPGINCGACGFAGCAEFAKALAGGGSKPILCAALSAKKRLALAEFLGMEEEAGHNRRVAFVACGGNLADAGRRFVYNGIADCVSAAATGGGDKACIHGCVGYSTCVRACPANAIFLEDGLAVVNPALCTGCGICVASCPRRLIHLVPEGPDAHVLCSSPEKGAAVRKVCGHGCAGCRVCVKLAPGAYVMAGENLASRDYAQPPPENAAAVVAKCPGKCVRVMGGNAA